MLRAVIFDVDFTLARPGPELGAEGYRKVGERHGLALDPELYETARLAALESLAAPSRPRARRRALDRRSPSGSSAAWAATATARAPAPTSSSRAWEQHERFTLYEDALPALAELRAHGVKIGLISNGSRDLDEFVAHHGLDADCVVGSRAFGRTKPHPEIFLHALALLEVGPRRRR